MRSEIETGTVPQELEVLRAALLFEHKRLQHLGGQASAQDLVYLEHLMAAIASLTPATNSGRPRPDVAVALRLGLHVGRLISGLERVLASGGTSRSAPILKELLEILPLINEVERRPGADGWFRFGIERAFSTIQHQVRRLLGSAHPERITPREAFSLLGDLQAILPALPVDAHAVLRTTEEVRASFEFEASPPSHHR